MLNIPILATLTLNKEHTLKVWAQDYQGLNSTKFEHKFTFKTQDRPIIDSVYLSDERIENTTAVDIVIYGEATDPDQGQTIRILARTDNGADKECKTFTSTEHVDTFAFFYSIDAPSLAPGRHTITIALVDNTGKASSQNRTLSFLIYDPNLPLPPTEVGTIEDISSDLPEESNAAFNFRYFDVDKIPSDITFNNEGFFAAFRGFPRPDGGEALPTHLLKYSDFMSANEDGFDIEGEIINETESKTGYKRVEFRVKNKNFFPTMFELGIFADSDFSGDDNSTIEIREDGRGIVVSNEAKKLHYTIFTKDVYNSPPVTEYYLESVERQGKQPIPEDKIPFFKKSDKKKLAGVNTMFGFHWRVVLPCSETTTFAVEFAGHDKVKTPPRVVDNSNVPNYVVKDDLVNLSFTIKDSDVGEMLKYTIYVNDDVVKTETYKNTGVEKVVNYSTKVAFVWRTFSYSIVVEDTEEGVKLLSNEIIETRSQNYRPQFTLNPLNATYHNESEFRITGTFRDDDGRFGYLNYRFVDLKYPEKYKSKILSAGQVFGTINQFISIPSELYPREEKWGIILYVEDRYNAKSREYYYEFKLNPYDPPMLKKAGLSKKTGFGTEKILGFAVFNDKQKDDLAIYTKVGKDGEYTKAATIKNTQNTGKFVPVAFYFKVPEGLTPGANDVYIVVRDSDGSESDPIISTLLVTN